MEEEGMCDSLQSLSPSNTLGSAPIGLRHF